MNNRIFKIDIDEILRSKAGSKAKFVPGFVRNWLKGIAHQDEINEFLTDVGDMQGVPWLDAVMKFLDVSLEVSGTETCPTTRTAGALPLLATIRWADLTVLP